MGPPNVRPTTRCARGSHGVQRRVGPRCSAIPRCLTDHTAAPRRGGTPPERAGGAQTTAGTVLPAAEDALAHAHARQQDAADEEEDHQGDDRPPVGAGELVDEAEDQRAQPARAALHGLVEAEELGLAAAGDQLAEQRAGQGLAAAEHDADQHRQRQERQERAGRHEEGEDDDEQPQGEAVADHPPRAPRAGQPAEEQRAAEGDELHQQHRDDQLALAEAELLGAVQAGGGDHGLDAVVVEQVGQQEQQRLRVGLQLGEGPGELAQAAADHARAARPPGSPWCRAGRAGRARG